MPNYLVVANETLGGSRLLNEVRARKGRGSSRFVVIVPSTIPKEGATWTEGEAKGLAKDRLERLLQRFAEVGVKADGRVGGVDPYLAIEDAARGVKFDEIILTSATTDARSKGAKRLRDIGIRVKHLPGEPEQVTRETALAGVPLFAGLSRRHLKGLAKASMFVSYRKGDTIVEAGASGSDLFVVLDGRVKVVRGGRTADRMTAGDVFGEISLLDPGPRTASIVAEAPTRCLTLSGRRFRIEMDRDPTLARNLLRAAGARMRELTEAPPETAV